MMQRIEEIRMSGMLPRVFVSESIPDSQIWRGDVTLRRGEAVAVEAASGGGKSSLCAYIYGSREDYEGTLRFNGTDVRTFSPEQWQELRRRHLAYLPQELSLFPELTAMENIELKNSLTGHAGKEQIEEWLHELGIDSRRDYPAGRLSIGQQQRVAILRSVCQPFDFILLDEPVSHLDEENNAIAAAIVSREAARQGAGIIATSVGNPISIDVDVRLRL